MRWDVGMTKIQVIMERLIDARKGAGLSQSQAAKLLDITQTTLSAIERNRNLGTSLSMFLKMCEIYDISPVWALTGHNPDFDEQSFDELTQFTNVAIEDLSKLKATLKRLSWNNNDD